MWLDGVQRPFALIGARIIAAVRCYSLPTFPIIPVGLGTSFGLQILAAPTCLPPRLLQLKYIVAEVAYTYKRKIA